MAERVELVAVDGVEAEIIRVYGEWPERYTALVFESSDHMPDHTTTVDRVTGQWRTGSWFAGRGALTLRGARKKARALLSEYIAANPEQAAFTHEDYDERLECEWAVAELEATVIGPISEPGPRSRLSDLT